MYLIKFLLTRSMVIVFVGICLLTGVLAPRIPYNDAPQVKTAALFTKRVQPKQEEFPSVTQQTPRHAQVTVLAIGEAKITPTSLPPKDEQKKAQWGVATQIDEHTWTMQVEKDDRMSSPQEIFDALNAYRQKKGKATLAWDTTLAQYAQSRSDTFAKHSNTDKHAGFTDYINNQDGFTKLGFNAVGENSSFGYQLYGVHLIEWVYAGDKPHDTNQLNSSWSHVGIGVSGLATDLIFAGNKR